LLTSFKNDVGFSVHKMSIGVVLNFLLSRDRIDLYRRQLNIQIYLQLNVVVKGHNPLDELVGN